MKKVIALGFFDGVHLGHAALLRRTTQRAKEKGAVSAACTFDVHPETLISHKPVPLLTSPEEREELMHTLFGVEEVIVTPFDEATMSTPWDVFVTEFLVKRHHACHLVAGYDYRFGKGGEGDATKLQALCESLGVGCDIIGPVTVEGTVVSSTCIRELVSMGDMEHSEKFLGHPYRIRGEVAHGKGLGRKLGFPTVNLLPRPELILPAYGVYACTLDDGDSRYHAVANIGVRPTVADGDSVTVESFLLDFDGDLYGREVALEVHRRLRGERRFSSLEELSAEVKRDAECARQYFETQ